MNDSNNQPPPPPTLDHRLGASLSYFGLATIGTAIYAIFLIAVIRGRKKLQLNSHSFYVFVWHFAVADIGLIAFTNYFVAVPLSLTGQALYGDGLFLYLISFSDSFFFFAVFYLVFLMSLNRFLIFFRPSLCVKLFERPNIYFTLIFPWIGGFIMDGMSIFIGGCVKSYDHQGFHFYYHCSPDMTPIGIIQQQIATYYSVALPFTSLILYLAAYVKMSHLQRSVSSNEATSAAISQRNKRERSFLIQAFIICVSLMIESVLFHLVPWLAQNDVIEWYWVSLLLGWAVIVNSSINPIVYFIFNQSIRTAVMEFLGFAAKNTTSVQAVQIRTSTNNVRSRLNSNTHSSQIG